MYRYTYVNFPTLFYSIMKSKDVMILTGAGQIGMAIARRMGYGMKIAVGDRSIENAKAIYARR